VVFCKWKQEGRQSSISNADEERFVFPVKEKLVSYLSSSLEVRSIRNTAFRASSIVNEKNRGAFMADAMCEERI